jgi:6-phosphogluconate dehydrogenase
MQKADIGLIGLAVMGQNLVLNMSDNNYTVAVFNRTTSKVNEFLEGPAKGKNVIGTHSLKEFFQNLRRPAKIILMVKSGAPVDSFIEMCMPHLKAGDILIDGGNSHFPDTNRRCQELKEKGILFVGAGISGGEEGARHGPSIMPGGDVRAWEHLKPIFQDIAAKTQDQLPCSDWVGDEGSGHYVKMVHNGIEYGDMQLICEAYNLMEKGLNLSANELHLIFKEWNEQELNSYLIEITSHIFCCKDSDGSPLIDKILDVAGQKGTGKWVAVDSLEMGYPLSLITEAVFARCLSSMKEERLEASVKLRGPDSQFKGDKQELIQSIREALYASKIVSYAQGFALIQEASKKYEWSIDLKNLAVIWQGGCIIRSSFLNKIKDAYEKSPELNNLLLDDFFLEEIDKAQKGWRKVVSIAAQLGIPTPCFSTALAYYDSYRTARLPANLLQAQRDFFGAHTYERTDKPRGEFFHTNWTGTGGKISSSQYTV